jgi:cobalt-zinc-cadmium efflux system outer membrane protein
VIGQYVASINDAMTSGIRAARMALLTTAALAAGLACAQAQTQTPSATRVLTLAEVLQAARDTTEVAVARQSVRAAEADVQAADHAPAPVLSTKLSSIDLQNGIGAGAPGRKRIDTALGIDWTWERGGKRMARTQTAQRAVEAAQGDLDETRVQQSIAAGSAFYDLLAAQDRLQEVGEIERSAAQLSASAQRRVQAGDLPAQDASRVQIESERSRVDTRAAQLERDRAQIALAHLLGPAQASNGQPLASVASVTSTMADPSAWPATAIATATATMPAIDADIDALVDSRADVRAAAARVAAAEAALAVAEAQRSADVTLGVSLDHYPGTSNRLLEVRASMPLNWGYRFEGEIGRAQAQLMQAQDLLAQARLDARLDLQRVRTEADIQARRWQAFEADILSRARQVADSAELAYRKGAMSLSDLLDARRTLRTTQLDAITARADHAKAALAWRLRTQALATP